jgi:chorismate dehydratase
MLESTFMRTVLRISGLDGLNAAPLQWGLDAGPGGDAVLTLRSPAASAAALAQGDADVALIPSIQLAQMAGVSIVPGLCVAARRHVRSVILLSRGAPEDLRTVAVDETSRTSVALLRILLARRFGTTPRFVPAPPDPAVMMAGADGALLIADAALRAPSGRWQSHDLAELWFQWTGLPFVFAIWAARPGVATEQVEPLLRRAREAGLRALPQLVAEHASRDGNPGGPELTAYLGELLHYSLGPAEEESLRLFFAEAHALDLIPDPVALHFTATPAGGGHALAGGTP